ncbi:MAG TPA: hypothetical protein VL860_09125, partial [Planctomycetota bacterium]|nr:hypothetical protein [Planctomycetota bacterium]
MIGLASSRRCCCRNLLSAMVCLWVLSLAPTACAGEIAPAPRMGDLQHDWDLISTRQLAAQGRINEYFLQMLDIALRHPDRPIAVTALGVAEHLTRSDTLAIDYDAAMRALEQFEAVPEALPAGNPRETAAAQLSLPAWYLFHRLRARSLWRAGRVLDAQAQAQRLRNPGVSTAWTVVGPFGRELPWAFDTVYPPEQDIGAATPLAYAGAEYNWHALPLDAETAGWNPAAAIEPDEGVSYARSPLFSLLENKQAAPIETVQILVWSTGPWKLKIAGAAAETAVTVTRDPGQVAGAELRLFETQLARGRPYRLLVKLPSGTTDINVLLIDPRTHRPLSDIHAVTPSELPPNPPLRELPLAAETIGAALPSATTAAGGLPDAEMLATGDAIRLGLTAYGCGAYDQARYYLAPIARQSAVLEYWYLLSFLGDPSANVPENALELQAYVNGASRRNPGNVEIQSAAIELLMSQRRPQEALARMTYLRQQFPALADLRLLEARLQLACDPAFDPAALLAPLPDRIHRGGGANQVQPDPFSPWYRPKRWLLLQTQLRDHRTAAVRVTLDQLLDYYARGHAAHCLWLPRDRTCPIAFTCDPALVAAVAQFYRTAGQPTEGYERLFAAGDPEAARPIENPTLAEWAWRLSDA